MTDERTIEKTDNEKARQLISDQTNDELTTRQTDGRKAQPAND